MHKIHDIFQLRNSELDVASNFIAGIECEIESVRSKIDFPDFRVTEDGSLRNDGVEFISTPLEQEMLLRSFKNLHAEIEHYEVDEAFSPRTSTHVHINCRSLNADQTKQLVLLYALFEEFFFLMVDKNRRANVHCVPLTETYLPVTYRNGITTMVNHWHKYTALNLLPLAKQGSVEFRHLQGTNSFEDLAAWLTCLNNLWSLAKTEQVDEQSLTNEVQLYDWWFKIFGHSPKIMTLQPAMKNIIGNSLLDVKFSLI